MGKLLIFHPEMISAQFLWGNVFLREELQTELKEKPQILTFLRAPAI